MPDSSRPALDLGPSGTLDRIPEVDAGVAALPLLLMAAAREPVLDENALNIFTDGSSYSSPRRGGYAFRIITVGDDGYQVVHDEQPYGHAGGTNQEMELMAAIARHGPRPRSRYSC